MIARIRKYFQDLNRRRKQELFQRGYDYAAGQLLGNHGKPGIVDELEGQISVFDKNNFDIGISVAISDFQRMNRK